MFRISFCEFRKILVMLILKMLGKLFNVFFSEVIRYPKRDVLGFMITQKFCITSKKNINFHFFGFFRKTYLFGRIFFPHKLFSFRNFGLGLCICFYQKESFDKKKYFINWFRFSLNDLPNCTTTMIINIL